MELVVHLSCGKFIRLISAHGFLTGQPPVLKHKLRLMWTTYSTKLRSLTLILQLLLRARLSLLRQKSWSPSTSCSRTTEKHWEFFLTRTCFTTMFSTCTSDAPNSPLPPDLTLLVPMLILMCTSPVPTRNQGTFDTCIHTDGDQS